MSSMLAPGRILARGVRRHLHRSHGFSALEEFVPASGLRVDVMAIGPKGEIWIVECKSSRLDFVSDSKWHGYLGYCDRFFWAVDTRFPHDMLPKSSGLIFADQHDAEIVRMGDELRLAPARRRALLLKFGRNAADRYSQQLESSSWERLRGFEHQASNRS